MALYSMSGGYSNFKVLKNPVNVDPEEYINYTNPH